MKKRILFVCLGNICRSPMAEAIMASLIQQHGLEKLFLCDSAGTSSWHKGESADWRMIEHGLRRGYEVTSISRPFEAERDFDFHDYIFVMDEKNEADILSLVRRDEDKNKIKRITEFCHIHEVSRVPDPYFGGDEGFRLVIDILEDACLHFLKTVLIPSRETTTSG